MKTIPVHPIACSVGVTLVCASLADCATGTYQPAVRFGTLDFEVQVPRKDLQVLKAI